MWVEFVVGSRPYSEGFSPGSPVFLPPQKSTLSSKFQFDREFEGHGFVSYLYCYVLPSLNKVDLSFLFYSIGHLLFLCFKTSPSAKPFI